MITTMQELWNNFHFLRPSWLLLLPVLLLVFVYILKRHHAAGWQASINAEAIRHLAVTTDSRSKLRTTCLIAPFIIATLALSGPSWQLLPSSAATNRHALIYLLDLSPSMLATDIKPNRITLARLKMADLLDQRTDGESALIVYAGDAHRVAPLTDDPDTIKAILPTLEPAIMPQQGSQTEAAVALALSLLADNEYSRGDILLLTDGVHSQAISAINQLMPEEIRLSILGVGTETGSVVPDGHNGVLTDNNGQAVMAALNKTQLQQLAQDANGLYVSITADNSDVSNLLQHVGKPAQSDLISTTLDFDRWHDAGYWLVVLLLPFAAISFKRHWLWSAWPLIFMLTAAGLAVPSKSMADQRSSWWLNDDQRAMQLLESGDARSAAALFQNPRWAAVAMYRAGQYQQLLNSFTPASAEDFFLVGNTYAQLERFDDAIAAYKKSLVLNAATVNQLAEDARFNIALLQNSLLQDEDSNDIPENQPPNAKQSDAQSDTAGTAGNDADAESTGQADIGGALGGRDSLDQTNLSSQGPGGDAPESLQNAPAANDATQASDNMPETSTSASRDLQNNAQEVEFEENSNTVLNPYAEQWLRTLPQDPGGYFRRKLSYTNQLKQNTSGAQSGSAQELRY